jgi:Predicted membrane protein (DUF2079)
VKRAPAVTEPAEAEPEPPSPSAALGNVRRIGYAILTVELICFFGWSALLYHRFALTFDYALYHQGWYQIAHGHLNPFNSLQSHSYWQDHSEFILWPLALLYWIPPHDVNLLFIQDIGVVVAEAVVFTWMCELAQKYRPGQKDAAVLAGAGLVLLVANPFIWRSVSFDFHTETVAVAFMALLARDLANGRRRAWVWAALLLGCGDVAVTCMVALGIGAMLASRRTRLPGLALAVIGVACSELIRLVNGDLASPFWSYAYLEYPANAPFGVGSMLKGLAHNPGLWIRQLWHNRFFAWQNLSSSGLLGVGFVFILPIIVVLLLTDSLAQGSLFAQPSFQSLPLYILVPVGTVAVLGWVARQRRLVAAGLTALVLVQALYWTVVYGPRTKEDWLHVPSGTAQTLSRIEPRIPGSDEVIASQGVVGRFSSRTDIQAFFGPGPDTIPLNGTQVWFVVVPDHGIETATPAQAMQLVAELSGRMHATLIAHANGVWAFRWQPPRGQHTIILP